MPATAVLVTTDQSTWIDTSTNTNGSPSSLSSGVTSPSSINVTLMLLASIIGVTGLALIVLTYSFTVIFSACERSKKRDGNEVTRSSDIKLFSLSALQSQPIQKTATDCYLVSNITHSQSPDLDHSRSSAHVYHSVDTLNRDQNISTMNHQTLEDSFRSCLRATDQGKHSTIRSTVLYQWAWEAVRRAERHQYHDVLQLSRSPLFVVSSAKTEADCQRISTTSSVATYQWLFLCWCLTIESFTVRNSIELSIVFKAFILIWLGFILLGH